MKKFVKIIVFVLVLAAAGAGGYYYSTLPVTVAAVALAPRDAELTFTEQGVVGYEDQVSVYPLISGKLAELYVAEGDWVEAGDPLCRVDVSRLDFEIEAAQAQIRGLQAQKENLDATKAREQDSLLLQKNQLLKELDTIDAQELSADASKEAQAQFKADQARFKAEQERYKAEQERLQAIVLEQNQADIARAEKDAANMQVLYDNGVVPLSELEAVQRVLENYRLQYTQNQQQLRVIEAGVETVEQPAGITEPKEYFEALRAALREQIAGIEESLQKDYNAEMKAYYDAQVQAAEVSINRLNRAKEDAVVPATATGVLTDLPVADSNVVSEAGPVAYISAGPARILVYVSTNDINSVTVGKEVDVILKRREGDVAYRGTVAKIDDKAEVRVSTLGVEERKVRVYVEPQEAAELFKIGYDAEVRFLVYRKENTLVLPKTALFKDGATERVWEIADGVLKKTNVVKGVELSNDVIVESGGLTPGSLVVTDANASELAEGVKAVGVVE
jgi:HlyD family secretion protein